MAYVVEPIDTYYHFLERRVEGRCVVSKIAMGVCLDNELNGRLEAELGRGKKFVSSLEVWRRQKSKLAPYVSFFRAVVGLDGDVDMDEIQDGVNWGEIVSGYWRSKFREWDNINLTEDQLI
ncbi:uncharacterized protein LOC111717603 [Eurytemora carolleeae]|uniref:uncharacterized protein LOC111717603 n=1 Tax=Eurytemora carolleeae TaxID=1294199 RepID=UPI000C776AA5|nr:uncharacterized protein LOC111717603 [Eurytemora carolleeae]XP_023348872.1 uncharacterized protein LOC111717603 [Eurytemora carolleeae]|eukprot:XP_023348871.1 uncharacterized protein LOC111717603 [Eurytemora affinis]